YQNIVDPQAGDYAHTALLVDRSGLPIPLQDQAFEQVRWADLPAEAQISLAAGQAWGGPTETIFADHALLPGLRRRGIRSFLAISIPMRGDWWGGISFLDYKSDRVWQGHERLLLQTAAEMIATFLRRITIEQTLRERI